MLADCKAGAKFQGVVLITEWKEYPFRNKPGTYITLSCQDCSSQLDAKIWEVSEQVRSLLTQHDVFYIEAAVQEFRGQLDLAIEVIRPIAPQDIDYDRLLPSSPFTAEELERRMAALIEGIDTPALRLLLAQVLDGSRYGQAFRTAPAALKMHQAYRRGLWEHSVKVAEICSSLCALYPEADRDVAVAGALLHDIGKILEYDYERAITPTTEGRLLGHIVMGVELISQEIARIPDFPPSLRVKLLHILTSHHGRYEWQSPKRPKCMEALIVHYADLMEAELWQFIQAKKESPQEQWSPFNRSLERYLFLE